MVGSSIVAATAPLNTIRTTSTHPIVFYRCRGSDIQQTATDRNRHRVRSIFGAQFCHQVPNVKIDFGFGNSQLIGDLFVAMTVANKSENFQFPGCKIIFAQVLGELGGNFRRHMPSTAMHRTDDGLSKLSERHIQTNRNSWRLGR